MKHARWRVALLPAALAAAIAVGQAAGGEGAETAAKDPALDRPILDRVRARGEVADPVRLGEGPRVEVVPPNRHGAPKPLPLEELWWERAVVPDLVPPSLEMQPKAGVLVPVGFDGRAENHSTVDPPDPQIAVGSKLGDSPGYIVEAFHRGLNIYTQSGALVGGPISFASLFGLPAQTNLFDPRLVFDPYHNVFALLVLRTDKPPLPPLAEVHLAVSTGPDPTQPWKVFQIPLPVPGVHADFPSLGYDTGNLYLGANLFSFPLGGPLVHTWLAAVDTSGLLAGGAQVASFLPVAGMGLPWAPRAVEQLGLASSSPAVGLFVSSFRLNPGQPSSFLRVTKLRDPFGPSAGLYPADVLVPTYAPPTADAPQPFQPGGAGPLDVLSDQLLNAVWRAGDLYTAHTIRGPVDASGVRNRARWYQIRTGPPSAPVWWSQLAQSGEIDDEIGFGKHSLSPVIGVDADLSAALVFTVTSANDYPGLWVATRAACDPAGFLGPLVPLRLSAAGNSYCVSAQDCPPHRWADYFGMAVDPSDPTTLWTVGEYKQTIPQWRTWISSLQINPVCGPCSCRP